MLLPHSSTEYAAAQIVTSSQSKRNMGVKRYAYIGTIRSSQMYDAWENMLDEKHQIEIGISGNVSGSKNNYLNICSALQHPFQVTDLCCMCHFMFYNANKKMKERIVSSRPSIVRPFC
jgi:hypothetical protein